MKPIALAEQTLEWLLNPGDPALQAKVLTDLLDRSASDPEVQEARAQIPKQPWVKTTLAAYESSEIWEKQSYWKYRGLGWTMAHLSELGVSADLPAIQRGIEHIINSVSHAKRIQRREVATLKGCQPVYWMHPISCLTARMVTVLTRYSMADHEVARGVRATLLHVHQPKLGIDCKVMDYSLLPGCMMVVPEVLKCWITLPEAERTAEENDAIRDSIELLKSVRLYRYVPVQTKAFQLATDGMAVDRKREIKEQWISQGCHLERTEKAGWLKFSFPHGYNPDLLEVLLVLGDARRQLGDASVPRDDVIEEGLRLVLDLRGKDGRWKMVGGLNGKMWADLDQKGKPSPWITYRALSAFEKFGSLD